MEQALPKVLGILGGLGPMATVYFYEIILYAPSIIAGSKTIKHGVTFSVDCSHIGYTPSPSGLSRANCLHSSNAKSPDGKLNILLSSTFTLPKSLVIISIDLYRFLSDF